MTSKAILGTLLIIALVLAAVAAYGWLRPVETKEVLVEKTLVDAAKAEGQLTIYGAVDTPDFINVIQPAFLKLYPWAQVSYLGTSPGEGFTRLVSEYKAGQVKADVFFMSTYANHYLGYGEGALTTFVDRNPMIDLMGYPEGFKDPKNVSQVIYVLPNIIGYNTLAVTEANAPKNWQDLANSTWNGQIVMDRPSILNVAGSVFAMLYPGMGNSSWTSLMQGIAANNPILTNSAGDAYQKLILGEAKVGIIQLNDYVAGKAQGLPIGVSWPDPVIGNPVGLALPTNAPHPNMAMLFIQFMTSGAGQYAMGATGRTPAYPSIAAATTLAGVIPAGVEIVSPVNVGYNENPTAYSTLYTQIFGS